MFRKLALIAAGVGITLCAGLSQAAVLQSQYGILDLTANGGINPNTGVAWQAGDKYRLAFHTAEGVQATSNDPTFYDNFATAQAQQNAALATSTGWTALVWVNLDSGTTQELSAKSDPTVRAGLNDLTGGSGIGGAGVPVYAMDGTTAIARNNADIDNAWSNPFDSDAVIRIPAGTGVATQNVHYSPFLDQFAGGDTGNIHGPDTWTGGIFDSHVNALGDTIDNVDSSHGNTNANNTGRVWNRFTRANTDVKRVYAISPELTVTVIPEPGSLALLGLGTLLVARRRRD